MFVTFLLFCHYLKGAFKTNSFSSKTYITVDAYFSNRGLNCIILEPLCLNCLALFCIYVWKFQAFVFFQRALHPGHVDERGHRLLRSEPLVRRRHRLHGVFNLQRSKIYFHYRIELKIIVLHGLIDNPVQPFSQDVKAFGTYMHCHW